MKKAEEILEAYPELEYDDVIKAMKEYAKLAIEEQLDIAANEVCMTGNFVLSIDKDSIINCTRIELK